MDLIKLKQILQLNKNVLKKTTIKKTKTKTNNNKPKQTKTTHYYTGNISGINDLFKIQRHWI